MFRYPIIRALVGKMAVKEKVLNCSIMWLRAENTGIKNYKK
jgi:hypothetical protein